MFLALRAEFRDALADALTALDLPADDLGLEEPPDDVPAVLASSVAFRLAGERGSPPPAVATELAAAIDLTECRLIDAVTTAGPYLNAEPSAAYYAETLSSSGDPDYGHLPDRDERVVVEHTSANPTGPVHVGRARNPIIGDAIARLLEYAGSSVERQYYVNDAGRQVAVFTWAYETFDESDLEDPPARDRNEYDLVRYYRLGNQVLESGDPDTVAAAEAEIEAIMQGLEAGDEDTVDRVHAVVDQVLEGMRECLGRLPAGFDRFVTETTFMLDGSTEDVIDRLRDLEEAVYEEEAWQLELSDHGIDKRLVFQRSDGTSLYPTRDIAYHEYKLESFDRVITVLGEDHELQAAQVETSLELLGTDTDPLEQVLYSYVNLPEGRMSTRRGTGVDLDDLLDEAIERAREEVERRLEGRLRDDDLDEAAIDRIAHQVGIGAVRYDIVSTQPTKAITFEWDRALDFEAQSAPHVQYVHARCCGILEEAGHAPDALPGFEADPARLEDPTERALLETIARFPAVVEEAADSLEPHQVATYTRTLAERYNAFYRECPVLADNVSEPTRQARLALVVGSKHTMANALNILGVEAPRSM